LIKSCCGNKSGRLSRLRRTGRVSRCEIRKLHPDCATDGGWRAKLQRYGLTQSALEKRLSDQIQLMKLVEDRLRPSIQIDQQAVETYYHDQLLPDMKRPAVAPPRCPKSLAKLRICWPSAR